MKKWIFLAAVIAGGLYYWKGGLMRTQKEGEMAEKVTMIPRSILLGNPEKTSVSLSPDGRYLSYLAPHEGVLNIWVQDLEAGTPAEVYTFDKGRGISGYSWLYDNKTILYSQDEKGDENWRFYGLNVETREAKILTDAKGVKAHVQKVSHKHPNHVLLILNNRNPAYHDVHRLDVTTGELEMVYQNDEFFYMVHDDDLQLRMGVKMRQDGSEDFFLRKGDEWVLFRNVSAEDALSTGFVGFDASGEKVYWTDNTRHDKAALTLLDLKDQSSTVLFEPKKGDISDTYIRALDKKLLAVEENYLKPETTFFDEDFKADFDYLKTVEKGEVSITSSSLDNTKFIVSYHSDVRSVRYYFYDRTKKEALFLFAMRPELDKYAFQPMHPVEITARDGLVLPSYLTLPAGSDVDNTGRPKGPVPMILFVHGGPHARDHWGARGDVQLLANRGYAVLQVNYRGSSGFGAKFLNAGVGEWGRKMHHDLIDAVEWAVKEGITTSDKVGIYGGSYGGYAVLAGLTMTPDVFACGVDAVGISNLVSFLSDTPAYWAPQMAFHKRRIGGDPETEEGRAFLKSRSPLTYADRIRKPLLIFQGKNDPRVRKAESDQIVKAMKDRNIPVTYVLYPDEGHGWARPENRIAQFAIMEQFLKDNLGGLAEPSGDDLKKSSAQVLEGVVQ